MWRALHSAFTLEGRVSRRAYATTGVTLMALKYTLEALAIRYVTGATWTPLDYLSPLFSQRAEVLGGASHALLFALALWTLPFVWIGAGMTLRRALDAGWSPWTALVFFVPGVNYLLMIALALVPSRAPRTLAQPSRRPPPQEQPYALLTVVGTALPAVGFVAFGTLIARNYGPALFLGVPFALGTLSSFLHNRRGLRSTGSTLAVVALSLTLATATLLLFALEGLVCIAMVLPLALPCAFAGAVLGRTLAGLRPQSEREISALGLALPLLLVADRVLARPLEREVLTCVEIDAPPERVWPNVIGFAELPPPGHWLFTTGVAYPLRARIAGEGVGAVRRCEFSTGAFVEPITAWEPPTRLAFDVDEQPLPMEEWSFYARVRPPHLERSFRSLRGEFRLVELPGSRTRLEGRTWYALELEPVGYWSWLADAIVHRIHRRVLAHVKELSEGA